MPIEDEELYPALYGEVVTLDSYKLQSLVFAPDVIFDIGANIGTYTHYAKRLFPQARVVAVEPHAENFAILARYAPEGVHLVNKAIGIGPVWRYPDIGRKAGEASGGVGYVSDSLLSSVGDHPIEAAAVQGVMLDELVETFVAPGRRYICKIDCEGAENLLFRHAPSIRALQQADMVSMEVHPYWATGDAHQDHAALARELAGIFTNHRWDSERPLFYAWRKPDGEPIAGRGEFGHLLAERGLLGNAAEIGVCTGAYSRDILSWGVKSLLLVDPWKDLAEFPCGNTDAEHEAYYQDCLRNIEPFKERVTIMRTVSTDAASRTADDFLDFCYIDAWHDYRGISVDLPMWWPKVRSGGILAGHDYLEPGLGVNRAVKEFAAQHGLQIHVAIEHQRDASFWLEKP